MKYWQHALITGGGSGLGLGMALRLLRRRSLVSVLDLNISDENFAQLDQAARDGNSEWQFLRTDVTDEAATRSAVAAALQEFGAPDLAINSAGIVINKAFTETGAAEFRRVIDINLHGSFHFAAATLPHMQPGSRLALIASMAGITSNYGYAAYGASKFGVVGLATTLRYEYEPLGIGISCICPPEVKTPMVEVEQATGNPVSLELKKLAGSLELDAACDEILAGLDAGRWQIIPGFQGKATAFAYRHFPGLFYRLTRGLLHRVMRRHGIQIAPM